MKKATYKIRKIVTFSLRGYQVFRCLLFFFPTDAVLAVGQPPVPIAAFDEAVIAVGQCGRS